MLSHHCLISSFLGFFFLDKSRSCFLANYQNSLFSLAFTSVSIVWPAFTTVSSSLWTRAQLSELWISEVWHTFLSLGGQSRECLLRPSSPTKNKCAHGKQEWMKETFGAFWCPFQWWRDISLLHREEMRDL